MSEDSYDILRRALIQALGPRPSAARRRQVAADLRALAEQQERMAARDEESAPRATRAESEGGRATEAAQERRAGYYVRIKHEQDPNTGGVRVRVSLGQPLWAEIGRPDRIDVQRVGPDIWLVPATGKAGYSLYLGGGLPSCTMNRAGPLAQLTPGRYAARLQAGAIVIGARVA